MEKHFKLYQHQETDFSPLYIPPQYHKAQGYEVALLPYPDGAYLVKKFISDEEVFKIAAHSLN